MMMSATVLSMMGLVVSLVRGQTLTSVSSIEGSTTGVLTDRILQFSEVGQNRYSGLRCTTDNVGNTVWQTPDGATIESRIIGPARGSGLFTIRDIGAEIIALVRGPNYHSPDGQYCCVGTVSGQRSCVYLTACPTLDTRAFGTLTYNATTNTATTNCNEGSAVPSDMVITCNEGTMMWSADQPTCIRTCTDLPALTDGMITYSPNTTPRFTRSTVATHSCNNGFELSSGQSMRTCKFARGASGGIWSGETITCQRVSCGSPPSIANGVVITMTGTVFEDTITYSCETGYLLLGEATIMCQADRTWTTAPTCPPVDCGPLTNPINGQVVTSGTTFRSTATCTCNDGYILNGAGTRTCQANGMWSGSDPTCAELCPIQTLTNGVVTYTSQTIPPPVGTVASYSCNSGYELASVETRTCVAVTGWSAAQPVCNPVNCGPLPDPVNGVVDTNTGTTFMNVATYSCDSGLVTVGAQTRTCQADGTWSFPDICQLSTGDADSSTGYIVAIGVILMLVVTAVTVTVVLVILLVVRTRQLKEARAQLQLGHPQQVYDTPEQVFYEDMSNVDVGGASKEGHNHPSAMELRQCPAYTPIEVPDCIEEHIYDN